MEILTPQKLAEVISSSKKEVNEIDESKVRFVIYARKSTDAEDKQQRSLGDQVSECTKLALKMGYNIVDTLTESESAKESDIRPVFMRMMKDLKAGKFDGVIAWHPDRLARNMKDAGEVIDFVDKFIIKSLKFVSFTFDNSPSGKMMLGITFVISKQYSDQLSINVQRGIRLSTESGKYINKSKHGYIKDPNSFLRPDGHNFILIKQAFIKRLNGETLDSIANFLNESGYSRTNSLIGKTYKGEMNKKKVAEFMKDPIYAGVLVYGGNVEVLTNIYDFIPMITVEEFMSINKLNNEKEIFKLANKFNIGNNQRANLLNGKVICNKCGEKRTSVVQSKKSKTNTSFYYYYRCDTKGCSDNGKGIRAHIIIRFIKNYLNTKPYSNSKAYKAYLEEMKRISFVEVGELQRAKHSLTAKIVHKEQALKEFNESYLRESDVELKETAKEYIQSTKSEIINLRERIKDIEIEISQKSSASLSYQNYLKLFDSMAQTLDKTNKMSELDYILSKLFLNFTVDSKNVVSYELNEPFNMLEEPKVTNGGR